jgi:ABC-type uncharacterized transport system permease subunit|tara:strand:+ start:2092 stop:2415 length:324 start_codon:yes stop_codon:yes gene_type:complete
MVEKKKSKITNTSVSETQSSDDRFALVIMNFAIDVFYSIFFIVLAYMAFWIIVVLSVLGFIVRAVGSEQPEELKVFTQRLTKYISNCLNFSSNSIKEKPFPFDKFPD